MDGFTTALRTELFIAVRSVGHRIAFVAPAAVVLIQLLLIRLREAGAVARDALLSNSGFGSDGPALTAYGFVVDGLGTGMTLLILIMAALAAHSFAYDRDTGMVRHVLIRRVSRPALLLAKLVQLHVTAAAGLLLLFAATSLTGGLLWDYGPVVEDGFELIGEAEMRSEILLGLRLALLPIPATIGLGLLVSVLSGSATQAITTALGVTLAIDIFKATLGEYAYYLYASFQPSLLDQSYLADVGQIVRGYSDVLIDERVLQLNTWVPIPEMLVLVALALWLVRRRKL